MPEFAYRDADHTYWLDNRRIGGVTEIITACGLINDQHFTEEARIRGRNVHRAIRYLLEDDLDEDSLSDEIKLYVGQFVAFRKIFPFMPYLDLIEKPQYHPISLYGGTPDLPCYNDTGDILMDIKACAPKSWHGIQLYAYADMLVALGILKHPLMYGLYLSERAYKLEEYKMRDYRQAWNACLILRNWRKDNE